MDPERLDTVGRNELEEHVVRLQRRVLGLRGQIKDLTDNVTSTQERCSQMFEERRVLTRGELDVLVPALAAARLKHPRGSKFADLAEEVGEVARAMRREGLERVREELLDVAVVALRMHLGELSAPLVEET